MYVGWPTVINLRGRQTAYKYMSDGERIVLWSVAPTKTVIRTISPGCTFYSEESWHGDIDVMLVRNGNLINS